MAQSTGIEPVRGDPLKLKCVLTEFYWYSVTALHLQPNGPLCNYVYSIKKEKLFQVLFSVLSHVQ